MPVSLYLYFKGGLPWLKVDLLLQVYGPTKFSYIHFIANLLIMIYLYEFCIWCDQPQNLSEIDAKKQFVMFVFPK